MTEQNDLTNLLLGASNEASSLPFGVFFYLEDNRISRILLFETPTFSCKIFGNSSLESAIFAWMKTYLEKKPATSLPLDFTAFPFFTQIALKAIQQIPFGQTASYQDIAYQIGHPKAARAIGGVCNRNPFPLLIPCHRVISAQKTLGGFAYSPGLKKSLLRFENPKLSLIEKN